ncbi:metalloregulator ArsR/SmtB family transcription factor [Cellulomonas sp. Leaf395]|uniref:metalloregulator ArsR/SmtB family transcription factor n=1 Tax=Cellulomonas sp. Leaf395 TaxID=1736362 RepID=UPI0006FD94E8|nr:metalloregulator ArsR/SmtB family transcription factor [Cellulomonas sp. Leaf395]KQS98628.1 ArsR family transcriptional regulator [Cellulomonas sp. Leaf395]
MTTAANAMSAPAAEQVSRALKALADPLRLRALSLIAASPAGEACVEDVSELTAASQPTVSHHLKVLRDAGLVTAERRGTWVWYRLADEHRGAVRALLESFAPSTVDADAPRAPVPEDLDDALDRVARALAPRFPTIDAARVRDVVRDSSTALARTAGSRSTALTERFARQRLDDLVRIEGGAAVPRVLFVCVANAGRSQLAAALLQRYAGDAVLARSAGSAPAAAVHAHVQPELDALGADGFPKPLTDDAVRAADVVVTMGCGDVCPVYPGIRYEDWAVGNPALASPEGVAAIRTDIDARVRDLLVSLDVPLSSDNPGVS